MVDNSSTIKSKATFLLLIIFSTLIICGYKGD